VYDALSYHGVFCQNPLRVAGANPEGVVSSFPTSGDVVVVELNVVDRRASSLFSHNRADTQMVEEATARLPWHASVHEG
jgi:hypothetical protein